MPEEAHAVPSHYKTGISLTQMEQTMYKWQKKYLFARQRSDAFLPPTSIVGTAGNLHHIMEELGSCESVLLGRGIVPLMW